MLVIAGEKYTCTAVNNAVSSQKTLTELVNEVFSEMLIEVKHQLTAMEKKQQNEALTDKLLYHVLKQVLSNFMALPIAYKKPLSRWLDCESYIGKDKPNYQYMAPQTGRDYLQREYLFWHEAAIALDAWVQSAPCRAYEKNLALAVYDNPYTDVLINSLIHQIHEKIIQALQDKGSVFYDVTMELLSGYTLLRMDQDGQLQLAKPFDRYQQCLRQEREPQGLNISFISPSLTQDAPMNILNEPQGYPLEKKVALILDLAGYFGAQQIGAPQTAGQDLLDIDLKADCSVSIGWAEQGEVQACFFDMSVQQSQQVRGVGQNNVCRNELALSSLFARKQQLFLWAGQSTSVVKMLKLARWAGGKREELTALSQALMAFFRVEYHSGCAYAFHSLHEVMDMAKNFGVNYQIDRNKTGPESLHMDHIDRTYLDGFIAVLEKQVDSLGWHSDTQRNNQNQAETPFEDKSRCLNSSMSGKQIKAREQLVRVKQTLSQLNDEILQLYLDNQLKKSAPSLMAVNLSPASPLQQKSKLHSEFNKVSAFYEALFSLQTVLMQSSKVSE
ncbi:hypothetical protein [uncultured Shewanella sp.]|uniref:hypothetical protein n=1 Tax=uncultured Shewanella sp. TaxID=173975 RepID=UPI00262B45D7|nr:hypothetical protein [uncultured Shewanella sp.]